MTEWPPVIVVLITYRRLPLALETVYSIKDRLDYPNIGFHVADDGSGYENYIKPLCLAIGSNYEVTVSDSARKGVGANMNAGIASALTRGDLWLHMEDDWVLVNELDLKPCVKLLEDDPQIGMIRLGRLSPGLQGFSYSGADQMWWRLKPNSDTYVFSGNPSLRHRRFHEAYGEYGEGIAPGETELNYCGKFHRVNASKEGPAIVHPAWLSTYQTFHHIGDNQSFKWHMESGGKTAEEAAAIFETMNMGVGDV